MPTKAWTRQHKLKLKLSDGGQGEILVPPYARRCVSPSSPEMNAAATASHQHKL
jgi:hypothetical protein